MDLSNTIVTILATFIFAWVCFKRRDLIPWLFAYISASFSEVFRLFSQSLYDNFEIISILFSATTVTIFITAVSYEYYQTFSKGGITQTIPMIFLLFQQQITSLGLQIFITFLLLITIFLIIKLYLRKRTPTHAFMCFVLITGLVQITTSVFRDLGSPGAEDFLEFSRIIMTTVMLITGIVAVIEVRIVESESRYRLAYNRAEFYKDLFVHDINNILQNLEFSLEVIAQEADKQQNEKKITEIVKLAKTQVNRGAELGVNVRKLSELETGEIKNTLMEVNGIIEEAIEYAKTRFLKKRISFNVDSMDNPPKVYGNEFLSDVFRILLNNAIRYNDNPEVEVSIKISKHQEDSNNYLKIEIGDNGIGMPEKMKKSIFYKIYEKPTSYKRIGLGLLLVREVVHSFNGMIWAEDRIKGDYKKGTKVILLIPEAR
ncbi:MAG: HAMP domain-containing histidine kinase [Candidatus Lokiarchaeota archaeon]|nr:HAMP domain-containing histidine kinase [Candidatus Lokiarchaeota archaeon]